MDYNRIKEISSQAFWNTPVISALGKLGQNHQEFEASLSYIANSRPVRATYVTLSQNMELSWQSTCWEHEYLE